METQSLDKSQVINQGKSCLTSLIAFNDEMSVSVDMGRVGD